MNKEIPDKTLEYIFKSSVPLRRLNENRLPTGIASGCLIDYAGRRLLLTVSHATSDQENWAIQIKYEKGKGTVSYQLGAMYFLSLSSLDSGETRDIDFSYVEVPDDLIAYRQDIDMNGDVLREAPITVFTPDFNTKPCANQKYRFSGRVMPSIEQHYGQHYVLTEFKIYENLSFVREENEYFVFKLPQPHPGHEHFQGCSGAPIVDDKGTVVALVCHGNQANDEIYGVAIKNYKIAIDILVGNIK